MLNVLILVVSNVLETSSFSTRNSGSDPALPVMSCPNPFVQIGWLLILLQQLHLTLCVFKVRFLYFGYMAFKMRLVFHFGEAMILYCLVIASKLSFKGIHPNMFEKVKHSLSAKSR